MHIVLLFILCLCLYHRGDRNSIRAFLLLLLPPSLPPLYLQVILKWDDNSIALQRAISIIKIMDIKLSHTASNSVNTEQLIAIILFLLFLFSLFAQLSECDHCGYHSYHELPCIEHVLLRHCMRSIISIIVIPHNNPTRFSLPFPFNRDRK